MRSEHQTAQDLSTARSILQGTHPDVAIMDGIAAGKVAPATPEQRAQAASYAGAIRQVATTYIRKMGYAPPAAQSDGPLPAPAPEKLANAREVTPTPSASSDPAASGEAMAPTDHAPPIDSTPNRPSLAGPADGLPTPPVAADPNTGGKAPGVATRPTLIPGLSDQEVVPTAPANIRPPNDGDSAARPGLSRPSGLAPTVPHPDSPGPSASPVKFGEPSSPALPPATRSDAPGASIIPGLTPQSSPDRSLIPDPKPANESIEGRSDGETNTHRPGWDSQPPIESERSNGTDPPTANGQPPIQILPDGTEVTNEPARPGAMQAQRYVGAPYHHWQSSGRKNPPPLHGQVALLNSVPIKGEMGFETATGQIITTRRISVEGGTSDRPFVVLDWTGNNTWHGHILSYEELNENPPLRQAFKNRGLIDRRGKIIEDW